MGGGGGGLEQFSVSPRPLGFGFGTKWFGAKGLGPGLDNLPVLNRVSCFFRGHTRRTLLYFSCHIVDLYSNTVLVMNNCFNLCGMWYIDKLPI